MDPNLEQVEAALASLHITPANTEQNSLLLLIPLPIPSPVTSSESEHPPSPDTTSLGSHHFHMTDIANSQNTQQQQQQEEQPQQQQQNPFLPDLSDDGSITPPIMEPPDQQDLAQESDLAAVLNHLASIPAPSKLDGHKISDLKGTERSHEAEDWFQLVDLYFDTKEIYSNSKRINTTLTYFVGHAALFTHRIRDARDRLLAWQLGGKIFEKPHAITTWQAFKDEFFHEYVDQDPVETVRNDLAAMAMQPGERAEDYITRWKNIATCTGYDDAAIARMFQNSLWQLPRLVGKALDLRKHPAGEEEMGSFHPESADEWYEVIAAFDRSYRQQKHQMNVMRGAHSQTKSQTSQPRAQQQPRQQAPPRPQYRPAPQQYYAPPPGPPPGHSYQQSRPVLNSGNAPYYTPFNTREDYRTPTRRIYGGQGQPMNIGAVDMFRVECYNCHMMGHMARDCPTRASTSNGQC